MGLKELLVQGCRFRAEELRTFVLSFTKVSYGERAL